MTHDQRPVLIYVGLNPELPNIVAQANAQQLDAREIYTTNALETLLISHADYGGIVLIGVSDQSFKRGSDQCDFEGQVVDVALEEGFVIGLVDTSPTRLMNRALPYLCESRRRRAVRLAAVFAELGSFKPSEFRERMHQLYPRIAPFNIRSSFVVNEAESVYLMGYVRQLIHQSQGI